MYGHIVALGEPLPVEGVVSRFSVENDRSEAMTAAFPESVVPDDYMAVPMLQIRFDVLDCGVSVLPLRLPAAAMRHWAWRMICRMRRDVGRDCRPEKEPVPWADLQVRVSGGAASVAGRADPDCKGRRKDRRMSSYLCF